MLESEEAATTANTWGNPCCQIQTAFALPKAFVFILLYMASDLPVLAISIVWTCPCATWGLPGGGAEHLGGHPHGALNHQMHVLGSLHDDC